MVARESPRVSVMSSIYKIEDDRVYEFSPSGERIYWGIFALANSKINFKSMVGNKSFDRCVDWLQNNHPELFL